MLPPTNLKPHPALPTSPNRPSSIDHRTSTYNPNAKPILALRMPDGSNLIVAGRTRHQIALADPTCKAVKTTLIDYDPAIHTDEWVRMTNAGEHIINRTATTEHYRTYFTHNPITHAQAIEQGLVPIDPRTGRPTAAYTKGRQLAQNTGTFSIIGVNALTWDKYTDRAFRGRDDGKLRAELDSSQFKYRFGKDRGANISADEYKQILDKNLVDAIEAVYKAGIKFDDLKEVRETVKKAVDNYFNTEYIALSKLIHYLAANPSFNREHAEEFVANNQLYVPQKDLSNVWKLESVLDAPELYAAYPQLRDVLVFDEFEEEARYAGAANFRTITLNTNEEIPQSERERSILHEVQHIVQDIEGFASGGNTFEAYEIFNQFRKYLQRKVQERNLHKGEEYSFLKDRLAAFDEIAEKYNNNPLAITRFLRDKSNRKLFNFYDNHDLYKRIAGEIEARNVEYRMDWSDKKRFITPFNDTLDIPAEEAIGTGVSLSLRRRVDRNINSLLNERETTLARVSNYIKREADRTANIMGRDTELQRAGVHFAQANAIINALDTYIFSKDLIRKNTAEYRSLRNLRHFINEYITVARKGKLPVRSNTIKAAIRERLETQLSAARETAAHTSQNRRAAITSYREQGREYQYEAAYMAMPLMMKPQRLRQ